MLYNVTTMATTWSSIAMKDVRLLKKQMDIVNALPKQYTFLNYLRCHDDIGWGLDFDTLKWWGMDEVCHKRFLNDYFTGKFPESVSRGELYNDDPMTQDARFCGTTASMCGIESAGFEADEEKMAHAIRMDIMLHAYMLTQSGIPMLYSGDEIAQINDYSYKENPDKWDDSRYIHRGTFNWKNAEKCKDAATVEGKIFAALDKLETIRRREKIFNSGANVYTYDVKDDSILGIVRMIDGERFIGLFNFSDRDKTAWMDEEGEFENLFTGERISLKDVNVEGHDFVWAKKV